MTKEEILSQLQHNVYCRLAPSSIHGVGVFALKMIPKGQNPFVGCDDFEYVRFADSALQGLDPGVLKYISDVCIHDEEGLSLPEIGINAIDVSYFLNHSATPNMRAVDRGAQFCALRTIHVGEELTVDYRTYDDQPDPFK